MGFDCFSKLKSMILKQHKNYYFGFFGKQLILEKNLKVPLNCAFDKGSKYAEVKKSRDIVSNLFDNKKIIFVNQIHSSKIIIYDKKINTNVRADGIITKNKDVLLGILTADCAPIIITGEEYFGILHVGWRGLVGNIIKNAVNLLIKFGEKSSKISFFVGPHLRANSFEVKSDFIKKIKILRNFSNYLKQYKNKIFFNYTKLIEDKISELDIKDYKISSVDTFTNPKKFFSHRYSMKNDLKDCGRQISIVGVKK